jgi:hypothetical protein
MPILRIDRHDIPGTGDTGIGNELVRPWRSL